MKNVERKVRHSLDLRLDKLISTLDPIVRNKAHNNILFKIYDEVYDKIDLIESDLELRFKK